MISRAEVKTTGLDTNDCWSIEIMHWKSRDERKWRSSPIGLVLYMGTESEKKSQMRKCGMIWVNLPLTSKGGGWWLGTIITIIKSYLNLAVSYQVYLLVSYQVYLGTRVMPGDQSWVTRASREDSPDWVSCKLLEQAGPHLRVLMTPGGPETGWAPTGPQLCGFHLPPAVRAGGWWGTTSTTIR